MVWLWAIFVCVLADDPPYRLYDTVKGTLVISIMDYENGNPSRTIYTINQESGETATLVVNNRDLITMPPGSKVRAPVRHLGGNVYELIEPLRPLESDHGQVIGSGGVNGGGVTLSSSLERIFQTPSNGAHFGGKAVKFSPMVSGERTLVVVVINFKSKPLLPTVTMEKVSEWVFDGQDNVDKLYNECTRGQLRFPKQKAAILGPFTIDDPVSRGSGEWLEEVKQKSIKAINGKVDVSQYHHLVMFLPDFGPEDQGASGLAPVGPECGSPCPVWVNTGLMFQPITVVAHELGHNLGWSHAGVLADGGFNIPKPRSNVEATYGDMTGIMGNGPPVCPNLPHQMVQKWVSNTELLSVSKSNIALAPFGTPTPNALQGVILTTTPPAFISFRGLVGPDLRFAEVDKQGKGVWSNNVYVHLDPDGKRSTNIARIGIGAIFTHSTGQYSVTLKSISNGVANVDVVVNDKNDCEPNPCGINGQCTDMIGGFSCQCKKGWVGPGCADPICYKLKVEGFGNNFFLLNGEYNRADDYGNRVSYVKKQHALFYTPGRWLFGPKPAGSSGYWVLAQSFADSPQYVTTPWEATYAKFGAKITCLSTSPPPPVPNCDQISGDGFEKDSGLNTVFDKQSSINGKVSYKNKESKLQIFWNGTYWIGATDLNQAYTVLRSDDDVETPYVTNSPWSEYMKSINKFIISKGKFVGLSCTTTNAQDCKGQWSDWTTCSAACSGVQTRTFKISVPAKNGGEICKNDDGQVEQRSCSPICTTPVNCVGQWSEFSACSASCGGGKQTKVYSITTTAAFGGVPCPTKDGEVISQACNTQTCPAPVNCVGSWSQWSTCSKSCGGGSQLRTYTISQISLNGGVQCENTNGDRQSSNCNTQPCSPVSSAVDCKGSWSSWSSCSASCGGGKQTRSFSILTNAQFGGKQCESIAGAKEDQACNTQSCGNSNVGIDCIGGWSQWGPCSKSCGGGKSTRNYVITQVATNQGRPCVEVAGAAQYSDCNTQSCSLTPGGTKVDCRGAYTSWSSCNKACGPGQQTRTFYVTTPPQNGGSPCELADRTTVTQPCVGTSCQNQIEIKSNEMGHSNVSLMVIIGCVALVTIAVVIAIITVRLGKRSRVNDEVYFHI